MREKDEMTRGNATRGFLRVLALSAGIALVAAACGGAAAPSAAPSAAATASAGASGGAITLPKPEKTDLKIGQSGGATSGFALGYAAKALKLWEKYGFNVQWFTFPGGAQANQALLAGQVDMADNSGGPVMATLATDSPLQIVFVSADNGNDHIYAQANIKTAADLKGKTLAISGFGSSSHAAALAGLKYLGLTDKDVTLTVVGDNATRLAALKGGSVAASIQKAALYDDLTKAGFNSLADMTKIGGVVARTSMVIPPAFQQKYPNTVLNIVALLLEASSKMKTNLDLISQAYADDGKIPLTQAKSEMTEELKYWSPFDGRCSDDVARTTQGILVSSNPAIAKVDPLRYCTNKYLDQLKAMGWQHQLGLPGY
jgi:NitT/TauT family transport system substrate-binding protein